MLAGDTKQCREAATNSGPRTQQTTLGNHFAASEERIPYSDRALEAAAIEWLVQNNQVCDMSSHLVNIANVLSCSV